MIYNFLLSQRPTFTASEYAKKSQDRTNYNYWASTAKPISSTTTCSGIVAPSSGCYQSFRSFQERFSVINGQRQCTDYCPITVISPEPITTPTTPEVIVPEYIPPLAENASRIIFTTQYASIPQEATIIQIAADGAFNLNAYLGKNLQGEYGYSTNTGQQMYTLQNTYLNYKNKVYIDILNNQSSVRSIIYTHGGIRSIDNLKALYNLNELILDNNQISDLNEIKYNINLVTLYLRNNNIRLLSPLQSLVQIENLYLGSNDISDASALAPLTQLKSIDLANNNISNITSLSNKPQLTYINLSYNAIGDLSPLSGYTNVAFFGAERNNITSITPLLSMTKLNTINLTGNKISDINPLLIMLASGSTNNGFFNFTYNQTSYSISQQGQQALVTLRSRGWSVSL